MRTTIKVNPDACIACTTCTVYCPVASATTEFLGPRLVGPAYERFRLSGIVEEPSLSYCANCKNCDISCPQGVPISSINMAARATQMEEKHPHFLRDWIVSHGETIGNLIAAVPAPLKNGSMKNPIVRKALDVIGISKESTMPNFATKRFSSVLRSLPQPKTGKQVALFIGCYTQFYDTKTGEDLVWALNKAGYEVVTSKEFCCCGVPMIASGFMEDARKNAARNVRAIASFQERGIPVLTSCPSCELQVREEYPTFFPELSSAGLSLTDAQEFLLACEENGSFRPELKHDGRKVIYHAPCHMRALGIGLPGYELMRRLGIEVRPAGTGCCGISGSYGFKKEKHAVSMAVGSELFGVVKESGCGNVATECGTCRLQITSATKVPSLHPVSIIRSLAKD